MIEKRRKHPKRKYPIVMEDKDKEKKDPECTIGVRWGKLLFLEGYMYSRQGSLVHIERKPVDDDDDREQYPD